MKWLQFQINRNCLFTNYRVNKFKPYIAPYCTYCSPLGQSNLELVSHLFWECDLALKLWQEVRNWLIKFDINLPLDRKRLLFGIHTESSNSILDFIILATKLREKFNKDDL